MARKILGTPFMSDLKEIVAPANYEYLEAVHQFMVETERTLGFVPGPSYTRDNGPYKGVCMTNTYRHLRNAGIINYDETSRKQSYDIEIVYYGPIVDLLKTFYHKLGKFYDPSDPRFKPKDWKLRRSFRYTLDVYNTFCKWQKEGKDITSKAYRHHLNKLNNTPNYKTVREIAKAMRELKYLGMMEFDEPMTKHQDKFMICFDDPEDIFLSRAWEKERMLVVTGYAEDYLEPLDAICERQACYLYENDEEVMACTDDGFKEYVEGMGKKAYRLDIRRKD